MTSIDATAARAFPWRRPRYELLLLALVAVAVLLPDHSMNAQDQSRLCLTQALLHGHLHNDTCFSSAFDAAKHGRHWFSDKAPGLSFVEIPVAAVFERTPVEALPTVTLQLWAVRVLTVGLAFLLLTWAVGRIAEGLAPRTGGAALVTFGLGTMAGPLAVANFDEVPTAALGLAAFALAWRRRPLAAGLVAGVAVVFEYQAALVLGVLFLYLAAQGARPMLRYVAGAVPGLALLAVYNAVCFSRPWRFSYHYVANSYAADQASGLFGIGVPSRFSTWIVFAGGSGLLVLSPVLLAAGYGLLRLLRTHRAEALACIAVAGLFLLVNCGYFLPYGGISPGPRFLVPGLSFLAVGLGPAFAARPRLTGVLAVLSVVAITAVTLTWTLSGDLNGTVWAELARLPADRGHAHLVESTVATALDWTGVGHLWWAGLAVLAALAALVLGLRPLPWRVPVRPRVRLALAAVLVIVAADLCAGFRFPYGDYTDGSKPGQAIAISIASSIATAAPGNEVDFSLGITNETEEIQSDVVLRIDLPPGLTLLQAPYFERGSGCTGTREIVCNLDFLLAGMSTPVRFQTTMTSPSDQVVTTVATSELSGETKPTSITVHGVG